MKKRGSGSKLEDTPIRSMKGNNVDEADNVLHNTASKPTIDNGFSEKTKFLILSFFSI